MQQDRNHIDWALFVILSLLWASAYAFTRLAVSRDNPDLGLPPEVIISARLSLGGLLLLGVALFSGQSWPSLSDWRSWAAILIMGIVGTAAPFYVITTAQQTVNSSLAALYVAAAPLFVAVLAHFIFSDDRLTLRKSLGLGVGFSGVAVLFGPDAIQSFGSSSAVAQFLCLIGTLFYAVATITARIARSIPPLVFSASFVMIGAIATWPLLLFTDFTAVNPSALALSGVLGLAIGPTALASVLYLTLVKRTSATFLSMTGYTIPIVSTFIGYLAFGETQSALAYIAFGLILGGVYLAQFSPKPASSKVKNTFNNGDGTSA